MTEVIENTASQVFTAEGKLAPLAACPGQVIDGAARFTVITPLLIRMEYSETGVFVDAPTLFAYNRAAGYPDASITCEDGALVIDTGRLRLTYRANNQPFSKENLSVMLQVADDEVLWAPGMQNTANLGGPLLTVDGVNGPVPLPPGLLARDGWYLIDDSAQPALVDGWATQVPLNKRSCIDWYFFGYGLDYQAALQALAAISGPVPMPRKHVHGSWYCRWFHYTEEDFRTLAQEYHEHDFPLDIMVMDMDWHSKDASVGHTYAGTLGWTGYSWNTELLPHPEKLLCDFKEDGIYVTLNDHPCDGMRDHEKNYADFCAQLGLQPGENPPFDAGNRLYMQAFFNTAHKPLEEQGVDFWWLDWQQDIIYPFVYRVPGLRHLPWLNFLYYQQSADNDRRGQNFSRWGGWGDHRHPINFSGDCGTRWEMLAFEIELTAASGNAGCCYWAHDIGGFCGKRHPETYARWVQFGALSSSLRLHSAGDDLDRRPWLWGEQLENAMRAAFHFRAQLFPYIYTSIQQCYAQTLPLLRPMYLLYPECEEAYQYPTQYLFGDNLLAAPIVEPGSGKNLRAVKKVWFPEGVWYNMFTGEKIDGGGEVKVSAAIDEIPVFARAGVPLPMQPYTQRMTSTPLSTLIVRCYPGAAGESRLYEDDGQTQGYTRGECAWTTLRYARAGDTVTVTIDPVQGSYVNQLPVRAYRIELPCTARATLAQVDGQSTPVAYDAERAMNIIEVPARPISEQVTVVVSLISKHRQHRGKK